MKKEEQTKIYRGIKISPFNKRAGTRRVTGGSLKRNKGITLIALVTTIVLMLILATITVNVVIDGNLFEQTGNAKKSTEIASEKSAITQAIMIAKSENKQNKIVQSELKNKINKVLNDKTGEKTNIEADGENFIITMNSSGNKYIINNKGNIRDIIWSKTTDENGNNYVISGDVKLQIGDYITYDANDNGEYTYTAEDVKTGATTEGGQTFSSNFETKWRLLGVEHASDGDYLMIVPETPIQSTTATGLKLQGAKGYTYGIDEMENISKLYGHGNGALSARTMTVEDINKITGYDPLETGDGKKYKEGEIGEYLNVVTCTKTYDDVEKWKTLLNGENGATSSVTYYWFRYYDEDSREILNLEIGESVQLTNTYYSYYPTTLTVSSTGEIKGIASTSKEYSVLFGIQKNNYWLATSFVSSADQAAFENGSYGCTGFFALTETRIRGHELFTYGNTNVGKTQDIMPIVYLKTDVNLKPTGNKVNNCTEWEMY